MACACLWYWQSGHLWRRSSQRNTLYEREQKTTPWWYTHQKTMIHTSKAYFCRDFSKRNSRINTTKKTLAAWWHKHKHTSLVVACACLWYWQSGYLWRRSSQTSIDVHVEIPKRTSTCQIHQSTTNLETAVEFKIPNQSFPTSMEVNLDSAQAKKPESEKKQSQTKASKRDTYSHMSLAVACARLRYWQSGHLWRCSSQRNTLDERNIESIEQNQLHVLQYGYNRCDPPKKASHKLTESNWCILWKSMRPFGLTL